MSAAGFFQKGIAPSKGTDTKESIIRELLGKSGDVETKTEIPLVLPMTVFDMLAAYYVSGKDQAKMLQLEPSIKPNEITAGDFLREFGWRYRINAISHGRKSRSEAVGALQVTEPAEDRRKRLVQALFG